MKLYDLYTLDGTFVDYREPINGEYYLDDSEDDIIVRKHKDKDMLAQFDLLTSKLRKILKAEGK